MAAVADGATLLELPPPSMLPSSLPQPRSLFPTLFPSLLRSYLAGSLYYDRCSFINMTLYD